MSTRFKIFQLIIITLIVSCSHSKPRNPDFTNTNKFQQEFSTLVQADKININGKENDSNSELEIDIINGKSIPTGEDEQRSLGLTLARVTKNNLKNSKQFDSYKVKFGKQSDGESIKIENYVSYSFKLNEL